MIKTLTQEYREGDLAVRVHIITLFNIPIFTSKNTTTNNAVVDQLTALKPVTKIKGFRHETED